MGAFDSDWRKRREWWGQRGVWLQMVFVGVIFFVPFAIAWGPAVGAGVAAVLVAVVYVLVRWMSAQRSRLPGDLPRRDRALSDEQIRAILADPRLEYRQLLGRLPGVLISASSLQQVADDHVGAPVEPQTLDALVEDLHGHPMGGDYWVPMHDFLHITGMPLVDLPFQHP